MTYIQATDFRTSAYNYGVALCWIAVFIYAASNSVVLLLLEIGEENPVGGHSVITFSNLFVLGSLISLVPMAFFYWRDWTLENLKRLRFKEWVLLSVATGLSSALTPALFFVALENTSVTNVAIVGRIDPPIFMLAAVLFLKEKIDLWALLGAIIILFGATLILAFKDGGDVQPFGIGELAAAVATLSFTASTIITRATLKHVPLGVFSIFRTVVGTLVFFLYGILFSGHHEFHAMFQPVVLTWIWVYAILIICVGQFAWIYGLKQAKAGDVALATSFSPLAAITIAVILLNEDPGPGLVPGALIMIMGIGVAHFGRRQAEKRQAEIENAMDLERRVNFKGI